MFSKLLQNDEPVNEKEELDQEETDEETLEKVADPPLDTEDVAEVIEEDQVEASAFAERVNED